MKNKTKTKKILMTGGGTAGHVIPNIALFKALISDGYEIVYIGSKNGIEKILIEAEGVKYYSIPTGKLRRYFSWQNFTDIFKVIGGIFKATHIIRKERPNLVFSKGGFVAVPVVIGGFLNRKNVIVHESDLSIGLANKIASKFSKKVLCSFESTSKLFSSNKGIYTGSPIREELTMGQKKKALDFTGLKDNKPFIFLTGGSSGSQVLNATLIDNLDELSKEFNIIHQCGKGKMDNSIKNSSYVSYEFIGNELKDIFSLADIIISRAGSNTIFEILKLKKPNILIPLSKKVSRGDQVDNAKVFKEKGFSTVLEEEDLNNENFLTAIKECFENKEISIENMKNASQNIGNEKILEVIRAYS